MGARACWGSMADRPDARPTPDRAPLPADEVDEVDEVDEASMESFPASDPPAATPITHTGPPRHPGEGSARPPKPERRP